LEENVATIALANHFRRFLFTTPCPLLKQEGEFLNRRHQVFPLLFLEGVGGGKKVKRNRLRPGISLFFLLLVALVSSSCGGGNDTGNATTERTPQKADQNQMNPQPRDRVQQGGRLIWPITGAISNFNYGQIDGGEADGYYIIAPVMPRIFIVDAAGKPIYSPDYLVTEPKLVTSPKQVVTYELNPKAVWYDGTPITAVDFIAHWKARNGTNKAFQIASSNGYDQIENVTEGNGKFEVVVTFKQPYADWKGLFWPLYPASTNKDPSVFNSGWKNGFLTSGGPFKFQSHDATAKTYTLVPNEKWWGNKPKLDAIVFRVIDLDAQPTALANGEIDMMDIGPNTDYYNKASAVPGVDIRVAGGPNFRHITINGQSPVLQDVKARQALAMAIDRSAIARAQLGALPVNPMPLGNHIFMANQVGYQDNSAVVAYDPQKTRQMLDEAGWVLQGDKRVKDGKTLAIRLVIPAGIASARSEASLTQNMLGQVGVQVNIDSVPADDFFEKYIRLGRYDFTVFSWMGTAFPVSSSQSIYKKPVGDQIQQNYARVGSDEIDRLFREVTQELDPAKAIEKANEIDKLIWAEAHSLTLYQRPEIWAVKQNLANMGATGFAEIIFEDIGWMGETASK
jgi:peptide/nickel transport system substrate-binding protein